MKDINTVHDYWNKRPCNIKRSSAEPGSYEWCLDTERNKYFVEPHIPAFAEFFKWSGKRVLEIGCGIGIDCLNFAKAGATVTAMDLSEKSLELAKARLVFFGLENNVTFYQGNAEELSTILPVQKFDLIYSFGVIHHSPHPERIIESLKQYLSPEGELRLMVYHKRSWKVFWILLRYGKGAFWRLDKLIADNSEAQTGCPVTYTYDRKSLRKLLQGFDIFYEKIEHIFKYDVGLYKKFQYRPVWYFRYIFPKIFSFIEHILGWHYCIMAKLK